MYTLSVVYLTNFWNLYELLKPVGMKHLWLSGNKRETQALLTIFINSAVATTFEGGICFCNVCHEVFALDIIITGKIKSSLFWLKSNNSNCDKHLISPKCVAIDFYFFFKLFYPQLSHLNFSTQCVLVGKLFKCQCLSLKKKKRVKIISLIYISAIGYEL